MLRLVLLVLYLTASYLAGSGADIGGGWDPDGLTAQSPPTIDSGGGLDPDG